MWTCDVRSKLSELKIFTIATGKSQSLDRCEASLMEIDNITGTSRSRSSSLKDETEYCEPASPLIELLSWLNPYEFTGLLCLINPAHPSRFGLMIAFHNMYRYRMVLRKFEPSIEEFVENCERLWKESFNSFLRFCDNPRKFPDSAHAILTIAVICDRIPHMYDMDGADQPALDHLVLALQNQLKIYCSQALHHYRRLQWNIDSLN